MKILIVDDDSDIRDILEFTFSCEIEAEFIQAASGNEAIKKIQDEEKIDLIICDYNMPDGNGGDVYKYLVESKNPLPYVFCSSEHADEHDEFSQGENLLGEITKPFIFEGVQATITAFNKIDGNEGKIIENDIDYSSVSIDILLKFKKLPCDLFVRLNSGKVLKILNKDEEFTIDEYNKYHAKGIDYLAILKENAEDFVKGACKEIEDILLDEGKTNETKVFDAHSVIMSTVSELGISEKVVRAAKTSVDFALDLFSKSKNFKSMEQHIFGYPGKYLTTHSVALSFVSVSILSKTAWDSPETRNKLVLAAFLHDATIKTPEFTQRLYTDETQDINMKDHPREVQDLLTHLKGIPPGVDNILLDHHERPDGSGFPRQLSGNQIKPLSSVFIFAHDIVDGIFKLQLEGKAINDEAVGELLQVDDYTSGNFQKCYDAYLKISIFK